MAFVKLLPREDGNALPVDNVIRRLRDEFEVVDVDPDAGRDHVAGMIAATLRFDDSIPIKHEQLARLQSVQEGAAYVSFGDDLANMASCCVMSDSELFFDSPDEIDGPTRPLVERAAAALGYTVYEG
jgi:hypothetical protein